MPVLRFRSRDWLAYTPLAESPDSAALVDVDGGSDHCHISGNGCVDCCASRLGTAAPQDTRAGRRGLHEHVRSGHLCRPFAILTLSRQPAFAGQAWARWVFSFEWPSIAYAFDILAWDFFFPLSALFAATTVQGHGLASMVRRLLFASAVLAFAGLFGVALANMPLRNIGIVGYAVLFPIASAFLAILFRRANNEGTAAFVW